MTYFVAHPDGYGVIKLKVLVIPGKHGLIRLVVPDNKPTQDELDDLHRVIAQTIVNTHRRKQQMEKEKENYSFSK